MTALETIHNKLEAFIKKYYTNELIKGVILFLSAGLLYLLLVLFLEYMLWLGTTGRAILFWIFITTEITLLAYFVGRPLFKMFKLAKGIDYKAASKLIGAHFPEVSDKLYNVLQLAENKHKTELLLASIEQKSNELRPIPFSLAINYKASFKYAKYLVLPIAMFAIVTITTSINWITESYTRVVQYQKPFLPPAPFSFVILNDDEIAYQNKPYTITVTTQGNVIPEEVSITLNNESYFLEQVSPGTFTYTVQQPKETFTYTLYANGIYSNPQTVKVVPVPKLLSFVMQLDYPAYTQKKDQELVSNGNAVVPEGTTITWKLKTEATTDLVLLAKDSSYVFSKQEDTFVKSLRVTSDFPYTLSTSNEYVKNYENIAFSVEVVQDEYPEIQVVTKHDSINKSTQEDIALIGQATDDYLLKRMQLVYYPTSNPQNKTTLPLQQINNNFYQFTYQFPNTIPLQEGQSYEFYFEVFDNDGVNGSKSAKSKTFTYRKQTKNEVLSKQLQDQNTTVKAINQSIKSLTEQQSKLQEINRLTKEKSELEFNDKRAIQNFLERQQLQEQQMQRFTEQLKENLNQLNNDKEDSLYKKLLQERLERQQQELKENERLLEELKELTDKINKEQLAQKLEQLAKNQQSNQKSLQQLVELTKRFYVAQRMQQLQQQISELAKKQENLANSNQQENTSQKQDSLNNAFNELKKQLNDLEKDNNDLKKPMELPRDSDKENEISIDQESAKQQLQKNEQQPNPSTLSKAQQQQKQAALKLKQLSKQMQQAMNASSAESLTEDIDALRQLLDNLVIFSFEQELLMNTFLENTQANVSLNNEVIKQNQLRTLFEHVDDSLFALSLRRPEISDKINPQITEVFYNIDKALEYFPENRLYQGIASQQKALTAANTLASFLGDALDNMNEQMMMSASGNSSQSKGFQLPDIIMSQEKLNEQMKQQMQQQSGSQNDTNQQDGQQGQQKGNQNNSDNKKGNGEGEGEDENAEKLYEIYKQQQQIRSALEKQLQDKFGDKLPNNQQQLLNEMEQIENNLLEQGFNENTLKRMIRLKHKLLQLDKAAFKQGEDNKRESITNTKDFAKPTETQLIDYKEFFNQLEILNRQVLPLRKIYKDKVRDYFKQNND